MTAQSAIESFSLAPDGERIVYALRRVRAGRYESHLWSVPWEGGRPTRLTAGAVRDANAAISPDGRSVAFVRTPAVDDPPDGQVWIAPLDGGEPWQLTHLPHGAGTPRWSPDGQRLAVLGAAGPHRFAVGPEKKGRALTARHITRTDFRDDETGFLSRRTHLWVTRVAPGARARQLTRGDFDVAHPTWSPDGTWLAFAADTGPDANLMPGQQLYAVHAAGGEVRPLAALAGEATRPAISPDGRSVAFIGIDVADPPDPALVRLWVAPVTGGPARCLTAHLDRSVGAEGWADLVQAEDDPGPIWLDDETLLTIVSDRTRNIPYRVPVDGEPEPLTAPGRVVGGGIAAAAGRIVLSAGIGGRAGEVYAVERRRLRQITRDGSAWQARFPLPRWEEIDVPGPGGPVQAWIVSPARAGGRRLPTVTILHGGPTGSAAPGGNLDATMLAAHGYRVVLPNARGSASFGSRWIAALGGRWGKVDVEDVMAVLDALVERALADPHRLGVMGLSYGGYLTNWLVGVTDRFAAAVSENGVSNQTSAWGNSYFGVHYNRRAKLGDPLSDAGMRRLWRTSPLRNAPRIRTPLLMLQAEEDRICPPADNEQLFTALKVLGREVEYVLYPEEHHEMKNHGRPDRRIDRMERILAWFDRWMTDAPSAARPGRSGDR